MKTVIFYSSTYNGNTLKIAESMAAVLSAVLFLHFPCRKSMFLSFPLVAVR